MKAPIHIEIMISGDKAAAQLERLSELVRSIIPAKPAPVQPRSTGKLA